ncbi:hypothetical protein D0Z00_000725 [Geotrichum galactomycetum]|uniref:Uncharacterized protein n=1 Tax=Geotrichum galactomycetum TaxID=27317 RepID=A0ACB6V8W5_9ASCO|nr:hypothetical protein D0Z00_000725 [Geotrichum candidum]
MPQFSNNPDGFVFDDEVPVIELDEDEMILHDSNGKPTLVVDKNRYHATTNSHGKQIKIKSRRKQHQHHTKHISRSSDNSSASLLQPPPLDYSKSATASEGGSPLQPSTPKIIPPFFQFMGAMASKAKDFFNGSDVTIQPPAELPNASMPMDDNVYLKQHQKQTSFGQSSFISSAPQYQPNSSNIPGNINGTYLNNGTGYMQQPEIPIMPAQGYMNTPAYGLAPMPTMLGAEEPKKKKNKKHRKHKKNNSSLEQSLLQSSMFSVLILLAGALLSVMISTYRPTVEGPISGAIDKMLSNLQMFASLIMTTGGALLAYNYLKNSAAVENDDGAGLEAPSLVPMDSIPAAGTSLGETPGMFGSQGGFAMSQPQQPWMQQQQQQQSMYQGYPPQGPPGYEAEINDIYAKEMMDQKQFFVPAGAYDSKKHGRKLSNFDVLSQKLGGFTPGSVQDPLGLYTDDDDDEYVDEDEFDNYYKAMPEVPGPYPAPRTTATTLSMMRPEILQLLKRAEQESKTPTSSISSPLPRTASTGVPPTLSTPPAVPSSKHKKKASADSSTALVLKKKPLERIKGVGKKSKDFYVDEYACKPYGPPPKRYRGVNV